MQLGAISHATYRGEQIFQNEDGFWWGRDHGYFETEEQCRGDIDHEIGNFNAGFIAPDDTPCLDAPWWEHR